MPGTTNTGLHWVVGKFKIEMQTPKWKKNTHVFVWFLFRHLGFSDYSVVFLKMDTILRRDSFWKISDFQMWPTHGRAVIHSELWYHILTYMDGVSWVAWHPAPIQKLTSPWKFDGLKTTFLLESHLFRCELLVLGRVFCVRNQSHPHGSYDRIDHSSFHSFLANDINSGSMSIAF